MEKSKKLAEDYVRKNLNNFYIFRLHNVFGKWCKPNYNSVIATFCYNISHNLSITINDKNTELELVYIDDVCKSLVSILTKENIAIKKNYYYFIPTRYKKTLGEISDMLYQFKNDTNSIYVPSTGDDFTKKLFATYISYVPLNNLSIPVIKNIDERGSFSELVRTFDCGQFSVSFSKPGIIRGNHFHNTKMERFIVVKGIAKITFESIIDNSKYEFVVNGDEIKVITIPVGYSHKIENIGNDEMILFIWCNELFDKNNPDTYFKEISEE
jgi:UDP-2-acetamido-2,6-beta-L-arabino-hexul-4-ose reductase